VQDLVQVDAGKTASVQHVAGARTTQLPETTATGADFRGPGSVGENSDR
jgi:hypothetical protein